jgi:hypothetical protein
LKKIIIPYLIIFFIGGIIFVHGQTTPVPTPSTSNKTGDVNNDNNVTIVDALLIAQAYVGLYPVLSSAP